MLLTFDYAGAFRCFLHLASSPTIRGWPSAEQTHSWCLLRLRWLSNIYRIPCGDRGDRSPHDRESICISQAADGASPALGRAIQPVIRFCCARQLLVQPRCQSDLAQRARVHRPGQGLKKCRSVCGGCGSARIGLSCYSHVPLVLVTSEMLRLFMAGFHTS